MVGASDDEGDVVGNGDDDGEAAVGNGDNEGDCVGKS